MSGKSLFGGEVWKEEKLLWEFFQEVLKVNPLENSDGWYVMEALSNNDLYTAAQLEELKESGKSLSDEEMFSLYWEGIFLCWERYIRRGWSFLLYLWQCRRKILYSILWILCSDGFRNNYGRLWSSWWNQALWNILRSCDRRWIYR